jgi:transposase InsO family protein
MVPYMSQKLLVQCTQTAQNATRQYILEHGEVWYNRQRRPSALGHTSPEAFETTYFRSRAVSTQSG